MGVFSESRKYSNEIIELYSKEKISTVELAKKFNCGETTIRRILKENNVEIRKLPCFGKKQWHSIRKKKGKHNAPLDWCIEPT